MPRTYKHVKELESKVFEMKKQGYTNREIAEHFGLEKVQLRNIITRHSQRQKKIEAGVEIRKKGRQPKGYKTLEHEKNYEIRRLKMENSLLRYFLRHAGMG